MADSKKYSRLDTFDPDEHLQPLNEESEVDYLPCYRFSNRGSFVLWRLARTIWLDCLAILIVLLPMVVFHINTEAGAFFMLLFIFPIISFVVFLFYYNSFQYIKEKIPVGSEVLFYAEIIKYKPSSDPKTWKIIGNHMSKTFIEENQSYSLFNEQDYVDLFRYLTRNENRSILSNSQIAGSVTKNPPNNNLKVNEMPVSIPNVGETKSIANGIDSENNETDVPNDNIDDDTVEHNITTNVRSTIPNSQERAFKFRAKAREQAIQSFNESDERYWNTLYPDFAE